MMQINKNITNGKVMEIVKNYMANIQGNIADSNVNQDVKNTSSYDERDKLHRKQYRISRSRSTSKPPIEGNRTDELK